MGKQRLTFFTIGFGVLILVVVFFFASTTARRSGHIQLPEDTTGVQDDEGSYDAGTLPVVEITPETVQQAIATLARPETYARTVTVYTYWQDGGATELLETAVSGALTRIDSAVSGDSVRHVLTDGTTSCVWYDNELSYVAIPSGSFSADAEQRIPTYEDILALETAEIDVAVYGEYEGIYCICVVTKADETGYSTAYWISLDTGLLVAAETRQGDELIYRMTALTLSDPPTEDMFRLPDGKPLVQEDISNN